MTSVVERPPAALESHISYQQWVGAGDFATGTGEGTTVRDGRLRVASPVGTRSYQDPHDDTSVTTYERPQRNDPQESSC